MCDEELGVLALLFLKKKKKSTNKSLRSEVKHEPYTQKRGREKKNGALYSERYKKKNM